MRRARAIPVSIVRRRHGLRAPARTNELCLIEPCGRRQVDADVGTGFAAVHESGCGPTLPAAASAGQGSSLGISCRQRRSCASRDRAGRTGISGRRAEGTACFSDDQREIMRISFWSAMMGSAVFAHPGRAALIGITGRVAAMKRQALICVAQAVGILISLFLLRPVSAATAAELTPFRLPEAAPANTFLAIWMAQVPGFYQTQGFQLQVVRVGRSSQSRPPLNAVPHHLIPNP